MMDEIEQACLKQLIIAWNIFVDLQPLHPREREEFMAAIHAAQAILLARPMQRILNAEGNSAQGRFP
jgi:hypothetical protein